MRRKPVMPMICVMFAALLVLTTAALSENVPPTDVQRDPKYSGIKADAPGMEPKEIPVGRKTVSPSGTGRIVVTVILQRAPKIGAKGAKVFVIKLGQRGGRFIDVKADGVARFEDLEAGHYSVTADAERKIDGRPVADEQQVHLDLSKTREVRVLFIVRHMPLAELVKNIVDQAEWAICQKSKRATAVREVVIQRLSILRRSALFRKAYDSVVPGLVAKLSKDVRNRYKRAIATVDPADRNQASTVNAIRRKTKGDWEKARREKERAGIDFKQYISPNGDGAKKYRRYLMDQQNLQTLAEWHRQRGYMEWDLKHILKQNKRLSLLLKKHRIRCTKQH